MNEQPPSRSRGSREFGGRRGPGPDAFWGRQRDRRARPGTTRADRDEIRAFFVGNLVDGWFVGEPEFVIDDYEVLVVGTLADLEMAADVDRTRAEEARIERFRDDTRDRRVEIAQRAEERFGRAVSWGAVVGATRVLFTTASVPMMTRLRMEQRRALDTLVESGVARSRSEALGWCVDLVSEHEQDWIAGLREALEAVDAARGSGPRRQGS